ncbi:unnamed protein product [Colias eurytheme]|nr:unnamed protein product [Colias eurytheme]
MSQLSKKSWVCKSCMDNKNTNHNMNSIILEELKQLRSELISRLDSQALAISQLQNEFVQTRYDLERVFNITNLLEQKIGGHQVYLRQCVSAKITPEPETPVETLGSMENLQINAPSKSVEQPVRVTDTVSHTNDMKSAQRNEDTDTDGINAQKRKTFSKQSQEVKKGKNTEITSIKAAEKKKHLHVWRLLPETTVEDLTIHVKKVCGDNAPIYVEKIKHKSRRDYASFIIGLPERMFVVLNQADAWPEYVEFSEWIWFRNKAKRAQTYAITETGCNESIHDGEIVPVGYHIIRCDRLDGRKQGGVLLAAAQRIELRRVEISNVSLDLVLSSSSRGEVLVVASDEALVPVDVYHPPLVVSVSASSLERVDHCSEHYERNIKPQWNFYKANYHALYSKLTAVNWSALYETKDVDKIISYFYTVLNNIFEECVPRRKHRSSSRSYPSWYTNSIIKDLKLKASLHKRYKESKRDSDYYEFSCCRSRIKKSIDTAYKNYQIKIQNQFAHDPKSFWSYCKSMSSCAREEVILKNGNFLTNAECAREFAEFFKSVYSIEPPQLSVDAAVSSSSREITSSSRVHIDEFSLKDVKEALASLKPKRSAGPDGIPAFLFRDCSGILAKPLQYIFNTCMRVETFPAQWKVTRVIPVPKGKVKSDISGYRPVAVLSTPAKVVKHGVCLLFADDLKLLLEVKNKTDSERLQQDIDSIVEWSHRNKLYFNVTKCSMISFTRARVPLNYEYIVDAVPMKRVTEREIVASERQPFFVASSNYNFNYVNNDFYDVMLFICVSVYNYMTLFAAYRT